MTSILTVSLLIAFAMILLLGRRLLRIIDALSLLKAQIPQLAAVQFQAWKETECQEIRQSASELASQQAALQLEQWKNTHERSIRIDAVQRSRSVIVGKVTEHVIPYLPEFRFNPKDARFVGSPIDFVVFDGLDLQSLVQIIFLEIKTGASSLSKRERQIRDAIEQGRVRWEEIRIDRTVGVAVPSELTPS